MHVDGFLQQQMLSSAAVLKCIWKERAVLQWGLPGILGYSWRSLSNRLESWKGQV